MGGDNYETWEIGNILKLIQDADYFSEEDKGKRFKILDIKRGYEIGDINKNAIYVKTELQPNDFVVPLWYELAGE